MPMPPRRYLDSCCSIGMHGPTDVRVPWKPSALLGDLRHAGIHGALVWHWTAREYSPVYGNRVLLDEIAGHDRLFPCWVLVPHHAGEMAPGPDVVAEMEERGVRAAKLFPRRHGYRFDEAVCGAIFSALEDERGFRSSPTSGATVKISRRRSPRWTGSASGIRACPSSFRKPVGRTPATCSPS